MPTQLLEALAEAEHSESACVNHAHATPLFNNLAQFVSQAPYMMLPPPLQQLMERGESSGQCRWCTLSASLSQLPARIEWANKAAESAGYQIERLEAQVMSIRSEASSCEHMLAAAQRERSQIEQMGQLQHRQHERQLEYHQSAVSHLRAGAGGGGVGAVVGGVGGGVGVLLNLLWTVGRQQRHSAASNHKR